MVMEFLEGGDLSSLIQRRGPLPITEAVDYVLQACEAIAEAHAAGIVHRDLKPANLFGARRPDGSITIKVLDFGISKLTGAGAGGLNHTKTTAIMGSPFYMSPEQMQSTRGVDIRTDIWGLGVILYELVTGRTPFEGNALPEVCLRVATEQPPPLRSLRADAPVALELAILRCLEKDRDKRYGNIARLAVALRDLASPRGRQSVDTILRTIEASGQPLTSAAPPPMHPTEPAPPPGIGVRTIEPLGQTQIPTQGGKSKTVGVALGVGALVVIGVIGLRLAQSSGSATGAQAIGSATAAAAVSPVVPTVFAGATAAPGAKAIPGPESAGAEAPSAAGSSAAPSDSVAAPSRAAAGATAANAANTTKKASSAPHTTAPAKPKSNCDPNFYLDAQGEKHFKPECFH
jgi:serine/threonine-protein kinase